MKLHQQGNEIIVTELMPMSELLEDLTVIVITADSNPIPARRFFNNIIGMDGWFCSAESCLGWLPIPVYDPSQKQQDDFNRGVRAMFDYLKIRIANNYSGNKAINEQLEQINNVVGEWLSDALREVSPSDYQEWLSLQQAYAAGAEKYKRGHDRYEKLRKLNVQQFSELFSESLRCKNFDEMVDKL